MCSIWAAPGMSECDSVGSDGDLGTCLVGKRAEVRPKLWAAPVRFCLRLRG